MEEFEREGIYTKPDYNKVYIDIDPCGGLSEVTLLIKWVILYKKHPELLTNIEELIKTKPNLIHKKDSSNL